MRFRSGLAGLALAGSALWSTTALSQPVAVPIAAAQAPAAVPDPDAGLEAREAAAPLQAAMAPSAPEAAPAPPIPGTLNAQFAAIQANPALAAPEPEPPPPSAAPVAPVSAAPLPPVGVQMASAPAAPPSPIEAVAAVAAPSAQPMQTVVAPAPMASPMPAPMQPAAPPMQTVAYVTPAPAAPPSGPVVAPSGPSVALSHRVVESAEAFVAYMQRASSVKPQWVDAPSVAHALELGGTYEQGQLEEGEIAYVALVALQDPRFVETLHGAAADPRERTTLARALLADPSVALQTPGARSAVMRAASALGRLGYGLHLSGEAVKHSAYDMQHSPWSLTNVAEPQAALLRLKARSAQREPLGEDGDRTLIAALSAPASAEEAPGEIRRVTPVVARGLTLAALAMLGEAGEDRGAALLPILADASNAQCVKMARLNLYQCLSVAGPQYEDVFCLGEHAMMETAQCVEDASGWTPAPAAALMPTAMVAASALAVASSIYVPVAMTSVQAPTYAVAAAEAVSAR